METTTDPTIDTRRRRRAGVAFAVLAVIVAAMVGYTLRAGDLGNRVFHGDEAVNAVKFRDLYQPPHRIDYDPHAYHGPALWYLTLPAAWAAGSPDWIDLDETDYRAAVVAVGVLLIIAPLLAGNGLGWAAAAAAAWLTAVSPAMAFYSRYYIFELPLVLFAWLAIACGWRWCVSPRWGPGILWAAGCGASVGLMHATKETCVIYAAAMAVAAVVAWVASRGGSGPGSVSPDPPPVRGHRPRLAHAAVFVAAGLTTSLALFTDGLSDWADAADSVTTFFAWSAKADDATHVQPWWAYLRLLAWVESPRMVWTEVLTLGLAAVGLVAAWWPGRRRPLARFVSVYAVVLLAAFSAVPYKTPWNVLGPLHALIVLAGIGFEGLLRAAAMLSRRPARMGATAVLTLMLGLGVWDLHGRAARTVGGLEGEQTNPWVYAHPSYDLRNLVADVDAIAAAHPGGAAAVTIRVVAENYWPLPWYLRRYEQVGYHDAPPRGAGAVDADVVIAQTHPDDDTLDMAFATAAAMTDPDTGYVGSYRGLRHELPAVIWVRWPLWKAYVRDRTEGREPQTHTDPHR